MLFMTSCKIEMKSRIAIIAAAFACCVSCVEVDNMLGGSLIPIDQTYDIYASTIPMEDISMRMADSLSGFSQTRITLGAIRDEEYGLTTRSAALTIVPLHDTLDFGTNPQFKSFKFEAAYDTVSVISPSHRNILQRLHVYELSKPLDMSGRIYCNDSTITHKGESITQGAVYLNAEDSLQFYFTAEYGKKFLSLTQADLDDYSKYLEKIPGIYLSVDNPLGEGGRISMYDLQLDASNSAGIIGNFATLSIRSTYNGVQKDTAFYFCYGLDKKYNLDSLMSNSSTGSFPQYCLSLTGHSTRGMEGKAQDKIYVEGGGGLKPVISASALRNAARKAIADSLAAAGKDPSLIERVVINKASLVMPFEKEEDYTLTHLTPTMLSPTCRLRTDTTSVFMGLTDASSKSENQGDIDRSNLQFAPDVTYHLQSLLKMDEEKIKSGNYDIWMLIMAEEETVTSSTSSNDELSEYYQYLAYQNYYNQMYGYGGYGGGYGGYGYNNYYSYMMAAMYMNSNSSTTQLTNQLDICRFYRFALNGPTNPGRKPFLWLVFSIPND